MDIGTLLKNIGGPGGQGGPATMPQIDLSQIGSMAAGLMKQLNNEMQQMQQIQPPPTVNACCDLSETSSHIDVDLILELPIADFYKGKTKKMYFTRIRNGQTEKAKLKIKILPGTIDGEIIILEGEGDSVDGEFEDVRVQVNYENDDNAVVKCLGKHLIIEKNISLFEALCDCTIRVTHPFDEETFTIRKEADVISNNEIRKIKGRGMPNGGDLMIVFKVDSTFEKITKSQTENIKKMFRPKNDDWKIKKFGNEKFEKVENVKIAFDFGEQPEPEQPEPEPEQPEPEQPEPEPEQPEPEPEQPEPEQPEPEPEQPEPVDESDVSSSVSVSSVSVSSV